MRYVKNLYSYLVFTGGYLTLVKLDFVKLLDIVELEILVEVEFYMES